MEPWHQLLARLAIQDWAPASSAHLEAYWAQNTGYSKHMVLGYLKLVGYV